MKKKIVLTPPEAQKYFKVTNQTLIRWSKQGKIEYERTPGNHRRYFVYKDVPDEIEEEKKQLFPDDAQKEAPPDTQKKDNGNLALIFFGIISGRKIAEMYVDCSRKEQEKAGVPENEIIASHLKEYRKLRDTIEKIGTSAKHYNDLPFYTDKVEELESFLIGGGISKSEIISSEIAAYRKTISAIEAKNGDPSFHIERIALLEAQI